MPIDGKLPTSKTFIGTLSDMILGSSKHAASERAMQTAKAEIDIQIADYQGVLSDIVASSEEHCPEPSAGVASATAEMQAGVTTGIADINAAKAAAENAESGEKVFRLQHNVTRQVHQSDVPMNLAVFFLMIVIEGIIAALFLLKAGFVSGFGAAAGLGLSISGANILLSAGLGGFVFGRFWNYGIHARYPDAQMRIKRFMGRLGATLTGLTVILLLGVSGLVRATGDPEHLRFDVETLLAAASNFESLMLWSVSGAFAILAWVKGLKAFADPYPGLGEACAASQRTRASVPEITNAVMDEIATIYDGASGDLSDMGDDVTDARAELAELLNEARQTKTSILGQIEATQSSLKAAAAEQANIAQIIGSGAVGQGFEAEHSVFLDIGALEARLPDAAPPAHDPFYGFETSLNAAREGLAGAYRAALEQITSLNA